MTHSDLLTIPDSTSALPALELSISGKAAAMASGLHPYSPRLGMLLQRLRLEHGLIVGLGVFIAGLAGSTYAVVSWAGKSFGDLDPFESMRVVIPSALALVLVLQIIWSSLHLGLMQAALTKRQSEIARDR